MPGHEWMASKGTAMFSVVRKLARCVGVLVFISGVCFVQADEPVWTETAALNTNAGTDTGEDYWPYLAADGAGTWVAVWFSLDSLGNTIGTDGDILFSRLTDGGAIWSAPAALNTNAGSDTGDDSSAMVSTDGNAIWVAAWVSSDSLDDSIGSDYDILYSRSTDGGASWSGPAALNTNAGTDAGSDTTPIVTTDADGTWVAAWVSSDSLDNSIGLDNDILYSRSTDGGVTWSAPNPLNTNAGSDAGDDRMPRISTNGEGTWVTAWESTDTLDGAIGNDLDILVSRSTDGGLTWSAPAALNANAATDTGDDLEPNVSTDGEETWLAVWYSTDSLGGTVGTDPDVLIARSTDDGASWTAPVALNSNAMTDGAHDRYPSVTTDRLGTWVTVWESWDSLGGTIGGDADILESRSADGGATWTPASALNAYAGLDVGHDYSPELATDGHGAWGAVWFSGDSLGGTIGTDFDILFSTTLIEIPGSVGIKILPAAARTAGAQWRVEIAPGVWSSWKNHNDVVEGLEAGAHTVEYNVLGGWNEPTPRTVEVVPGKLKKKTGQYCAHGSVVATLKPKAALRAGARWRVSTGPTTWSDWKKSGQMVGGLAAGAHQIQCNTVPGYTAPGSKSVTISSTAGSMVVRKYK